MSESQLPEIQLSFDDLAALFAKLGSQLSPAYLHGSLVGVLAGGKRMSADDWLDWSLDLIAPQEEVDQTLETILQGLYLKSLTELEDEGFPFQLLLPTEDAPLEDRLMALSDWAGSFLGAFGATGVVSETSEMPATLQEILEDLSDIAQVDATGAEDVSGAEDDYVAVAEHVRVSVLTVFLEYNEPPEPADQDATVH